MRYIPSAVMRPISALLAVLRHVRYIAELALLSISLHADMGRPDRPDAALDFRRIAATSRCQDAFRPQTVRNHRRRSIGFISEVGTRVGPDISGSLPVQVLLTCRLLALACRQ